MRNSWVNPFNALKARAYSEGVRAVDLTVNRPDSSAIARCTPLVAWRHRAVPVAVRTGERKPAIYFAVGPDADRERISRSLQECHEEKVMLVLALEEQIQETLTRLYGPHPDRVSEG
jgi:hypothetical protein